MKTCLPLIWFAVLPLVVLIADEKPKSPATAPQAEKTPKRQAKAKSKSDTIDLEKAKRLFQKKKSGEALSEEEEVYLRKVIQARNSRALLDREKTGLKPLNEMTAEDRYLDQDGGLYGGGKNVPPEKHQRAAEAESAKIQPLNSAGEPANDGKIGLISISMSNATMEFSTFKKLADADPSKSARVAVVDCAQGGQAMAEWVDPEGQPWSVADKRLKEAEVSNAQVQVAWIKLANKGPTGSLQDHGEKLQDDTLAVLHNAAQRFPNLRIVYLGSRIYGGYTQGMLNPEPFAYESAFPARWLIQDQIKGDAELNFDSAHGKRSAPLLLWGPYLWADGVTPRQDGLVWKREDLGPDGTHPSLSGRDKVARELLDFFKKDSLARRWFVGK